MSLPETGDPDGPQAPNRAHLVPSYHESAPHVPRFASFIEGAPAEYRRRQPRPTTYEAPQQAAFFRFVAIWNAFRLDPPSILPYYFNTSVSPVDLSSQRQIDLAQPPTVAGDLIIPRPSITARTVPLGQVPQPTARSPTIPPQEDSSAPKPTRSVRQEKLKVHLEPILAESSANCSHIFLCWGPSSRCNIIAVRIPHATDDVSKWKLIRKAWSANRERWKRYIPFSGVRQIEIVQIAIAGASRPNIHNSETAGHFVGIRSPAPELHIEKHHHESVLAEYELRYTCICDASIGMTECHEDWEELQTHSIACPVAKRYAARRYLRAYDTLRFMPLAFADPSLARENDLFKGKNLLHSHWDILSKINKQPNVRLGELDFKALYLDDRATSQRSFFALMAVLIIAIVIAAKFMFGEWGVAWTIGTFFIALAALYRESERD